MFSANAIAGTTIQIVAATAAAHRSTLTATVADTRPLYRWPLPREARECGHLKKQ
jgi:hypothetical protein